MKKLLLFGLVSCWVIAAQATLVDNFESYNIGNLGTVASPPWTSVVFAASANVQIAQEPDGNKYFLNIIPGTAVIRGGARAIEPIPNASTAATFFLRFYAETTSLNHSFGLSSISMGGFTNFPQYNVQLRLFTVAGSPVLDVRDGGAFVTAATLQTATWYNVWTVINQSVDRFDVYLTTGLANATAANRIYTNAAFRTGTTAPLITFATLMIGAGSGNARFDDLYQFDGVYLTNPIPEPTTLALLGLGIGALLAWRRK